MMINFWGRDISEQERAKRRVAIKWQLRSMGFMVPDGPQSTHNLRKARSVAFRIVLGRPAFSTVLNAHFQIFDA